MIVWRSHFKKDFKHIAKCGKDLEKLAAVIKELPEQHLLPVKNRNHKLKGGGYDAYWECHIDPDWLLIYQITDTEVVLVRTGSHSDLF